MHGIAPIWLALLLFGQLDMPPKGNKRPRSAALHSLVGTCCDVKLARIVNTLAEGVARGEPLPRRLKIKGFCAIKKGTRTTLPEGEGFLQEVSCRLTA